MPFFRIEQEWSIQAKTTHKVKLLITEGMFRDEMHLFVDDVLVLRIWASYANMRGIKPFEVDGRPFELCWWWGFWGNPVSIVVRYKERILAQYGTSRAADLDFDHTD